MSVAETISKYPDNVPADRVIDFDMFNPFTVEPDFHQAWVRLRMDTPQDLVWTPHNEGHWLALSPELIGQVYADADRFSSRIVMVPKSTAGEAYSNFIPLSLPPATHRPFRKLLNDKLYSAAINPSEPDVRALCAELIDTFVANKRCDFVHEFAEQLPLRVFMRLVDLPVSDLPRLKQLADQFTRPDGSMTPAEASDAFRDYLLPVLDARRGSGRSDLLTHIADGMIRGRPITATEAINLASQAMVGGLDTVVNLMGFAMQTLARHPEVQQRIAADFAIIPAVVGEIMRRLPLITDAREIIADTVIDGCTLKAGDMIVAPTAVYALDPKTDPGLMNFDIDRKGVHYLTFGTGYHICPGQYLARMEMKVLLEEWCKRIPAFRLAPDQDIRHIGGIVGGTQPYFIEWD